MHQKTRNHIRSHIYIHTHTRTHSFKWNYLHYSKSSTSVPIQKWTIYDRSAKTTGKEIIQREGICLIHQVAFDRTHESVEKNYFYCFASASLLLISLLFFVTTPPGLGSAAPKDGFFLADWELAICFSFDFFTIFPVVVVGVFFGLVWDTGLSTWRRRRGKKYWD